MAAARSHSAARAACHWRSNRRRQRRTAGTSRTCHSWSPSAGTGSSASWRTGACRNSGSATSTSGASLRRAAGADCALRTGVGRPLDVQVDLRARRYERAGGRVLLGDTRIGRVGAQRAREDVANNETAALDLRHCVAQELTRGRVVAHGDGRRRRSRRRGGWNCWGRCGDWGPGQRDGCHRSRARSRRRRRCRGWTK